jgi:uncharacterized delta-60 repeat protein
MKRYVATFPALGLACFACQSILGIEDTTERAVDASAESGGASGSAGASGSGATGGVEDSGQPDAACNDFSVSAIPAVSVVQGNTIQVDVSVTLGSCFGSAIGISAKAVNDVSIVSTQLGVGAMTGSVTVSTEGDTPFGTSTLSLEFSGGGTTRTTDLVVTVKGPSGEVDPTFSVYTVASNIIALDIEPDADIVVGINPTAPYWGWAVQRLKPNGLVDTSFMAPTTLPTTGGLRALTIAKNGQIVIAGDVTTGGGVSLVRLAASGVPDPFLGPNGVYTISVGVFPSNIIARGLAVASDDRILFSGDMDTDGFFGRVDPDAPVVPANPGKVDLEQTFPAASMNFVGVESTRYVVGGTSGGHVRVAGFLPTGAVDASFGADAGSTTYSPTGSEAIYEGVITSAAIFLCGSVESGTDVLPAIFRFTPDGKDPTHTAVAPPLANNYRYYSCAAGPDGKIVAVGKGGSSGTGYRSVVTRFNADGTVDTTFASQEPRDRARRLQSIAGHRHQTLGLRPKVGLVAR